MSSQRRRIRIIPIFPTSPERGLAENLAASALNIAATVVLAKLGVTWEPPESQHQSSLDQQYKATNYKILLEKQEVEKTKSQTQLLKAQAQLKLLEQKVAEKEAKAGKEQTETLSVQKTEMDLHIKTEVISGTLEVVANSEGLTGSAEGQGAARAWQEALPQKVILLLGKRGSGKTATAAELAEYMMAIHNVLTFWVGLPLQARDLVPRWIQIVKSLEEIPNNAFVLIDEAGLSYLSLQFASDRNVALRQCLMLCRQRNWTMVFCAQNSRDIDESIIRQCTTIVFKEPAMFAGSERTEIKAKAIKAAQVFKQIPVNERRGMAMVFDDGGFEGIIKLTLPSFWSEALSNIYGQVGSYGVNKRNRSGSIGQTARAAQTSPRRPYVTDEEIREVRKQGKGYERISKDLDVTVYRVRKVLAELDPLDEE